VITSDEHDQLSLATDSATNTTRIGTISLAARMTSLTGSWSRAREGSKRTDGELSGRSGMI
jgi:hypothetical protein